MLFLHLLPCPISFSGPTRKQSISWLFLLTSGRLIFEFLFWIYLIFDCPFTCSLLWTASLVSQYYPVATFQSGMPKNTGPFLGTTKKLHWNLTLLSGWCIHILCHLFQMADICEACALYLSISIFVGACFYIFVCSLCHYNCLAFFTISISLLSFIASRIPFCTLCTSLGPT